MLPWLQRARLAEILHEVTMDRFVDPDLFSRGAWDPTARVLTETEILFIHELDDAVGG